MATAAVQKILLFEKSLQNKMKLNSHLTGQSGVNYNFILVCMDLCIFLYIYPYAAYKLTIKIYIRTVHMYIHIYK